MTARTVRPWDLKPGDRIRRNGIICTVTARAYQMTPHTVAIPTEPDLLVLYPTRHAQYDCVQVEA